MSEAKQNEVSEAPMVWTHYGFATVSIEPPSRRDILWSKMPENSIYTFDGDGWYRIDPPDQERFPDGDLKHL